MNKHIWSLIDASRGSFTTEEFIELFAACSAWLKLSDDKQLDELHKYTGTNSKERLLTVLNDCIDVNFSLPIWDLTDDKIELLLKSLRELINAKVISYVELSDTIKQLQTENSKDSGIFSIPIELCSLGVALLGDKTKSVYCPFNNGSDFAFQLPKTSEKFGENYVNADQYFAEIHNILLDENFQTVNSDPIASPYYIGEGGLRQFTSSLAMPPFNVKLQQENIKDIWGRFPETPYHSEVYFLRHMLAQTSDIVVCFVANGFLSRTAAGEKQFKQDVLSKNWVKTVIALPSNLLSNTAIAVSIIVLDKNKTARTVNFIDAATEEFVDKTARTRNRLTAIDKIIEAYNSDVDSPISKHCTHEQIEENDFNLLPTRYVSSEESQMLKSFLASHNTARLEELVDIIRPQAVKHNEKGETVFTEYNLSSLNDVGELTGQGKSIKVGVKELKQVKKQVIKANDVLVVCRGAVGTIALVSESIEENALASQAFSILRVKPHISGVTPESIYQYLISEFGQIQLSLLVTGTGSANLPAKDLNELSMPLFDATQIEKIKQIRQQVLDTHHKIKELKQNITEINNNWLA